VTSGMLPRRKGSYGIDAPHLLPIPVALIVAHITQGVVSGTAWPFVAAGFVIACVGCGLHTSLRGKFAVWSKLLDGLSLRGD
jgi:arsenite methyltransferase